jgi:hypothetical protein
MEGRSFAEIGDELHCTRWAARAAFKRALARRRAPDETLSEWRAVELERLQAAEVRLQRQIKIDRVMVETVAKAMLEHGIGVDRVDLDAAHRRYATTEALVMQLSRRRSELVGLNAPSAVAVGIFGGGAESQSGSADDGRQHLMAELEKLATGRQDQQRSRLGELYDVKQQLDRLADGSMHPNEVAVAKQELLAQMRQLVERYEVVRPALPAPVAESNPDITRVDSEAPGQSPARVEVVEAEPDGWSVPNGYGVWECPTCGHQVPPHGGPCSRCGTRRPRT